MDLGHEDMASSLCHRAHFVRDSTRATLGFGCSVPPRVDNGAIPDALKKKIRPKQGQTTEKKDIPSEKP